MLRLWTRRQWTLVLLGGLMLGVNSLWGQSGDPSLVGWWTFDEGAGSTLIDSSGYGNGSGPATGAHGWDANGRINGAGEFDGAGQYVELIESDSLNPVDEITIAVWINITNAGTGTPMAILMKGEFTYGLRVDDANNIEFWIYSDGFKRAETPIDDGFNGAWHHLAATFDGGRLSLYIDGERKAETAFSGAINVNTEYPLNIGRNNQGGTANTWFFNGQMDDLRLYNRALSQAEIQKMLTPEFASLPNPTDGARQAWPDTPLSWVPGLGAESHDVYLGTDALDVHEATSGDPRGVLAGRLAGEVSSYDPGGLEFDQTYYWRVDEVQGGTVYPGEVWSFSVPTGFLVENIGVSASTSFNSAVVPQNAVNGSGLDGNGHSDIENDMWVSDVDPAAWIEFEFDRVYQLHDMRVWNYNSSLEFILGLGVRSAEIGTSIDGVTFTAVDDVPEFSQGTSLPGYVTDTVIGLDTIFARYVRITPTSSWGGLPQYGLSEVQFTYIPTHASVPRPAQGQSIEGLDFTLAWQEGRGSVSHDLYVSNDLAAVEEGSAFISRITENAYDSASLDLLYGQTVFWRVDEINEQAQPPLVEGNIWRFSVLDYLVIDDFENYSNESPNIPYQTWVDGLGYAEDDFFEENLGNGSGALVGHDIYSVDSPFFGGSLMEPNIVNSGAQSMPVYYDNSGAGGVAMYSEIERTWNVPQDWRRGMPDTLSLSIAGDPNNAAETLYVALEDSSGAASKRIVVHEDPLILQSTTWQLWDIPLSEFGTINLASIRKMYVGVGNSLSPQPGGAGVFYLDDLRVSRANTQN